MKEKELIIKNNSNSIKSFTLNSNSSPSILLDLIVISLILFSFYYFSGIGYYITIVFTLFYVKSKTTTILNESILAIRGLGLQLSTSTGFKLKIPFLNINITIPIFKKNLFLPLQSISDIVLNEGISGWNIIYYLVIIMDDGKDVKLRVGFPEMLPRLAELRLIWQGTRATVFDELYEEES